VSKGFKDETDLWGYQRKRLLGRWDRYELVFPEGHPDVKGSYVKRIHYIENKVGEPDINALEASQVDYIRWLLICDQSVWVCFGSKKAKEVTWTKAFLVDDAGDFALKVDMPPPFWKP
jgi:hypothetical protein